MTHRVREAMNASTQPPMGGEGEVVEINETFIGNKKAVKVTCGYRDKHAVMTFLQRDASARSYHVHGTGARDLLPIIKANVLPGTRIMKDDASQYSPLGRHFTKHDFVRHAAGEYMRSNTHTNTAEGYYSVFKRGRKGVYQHWAEKHLHR